MRIQPLLPYLDKSDPWSSHSILHRWLAELPAGAVVLDIGTASGSLGRACQGMGLVLKGIEPNPEWAQLARPYYNAMHIGEIQTAPQEFVNGAAAVVFADVLEHMVDPQTVLVQMVQCQPAGCRFLISLPNVANLWVRLSLLFGRFTYAERGILDRTHLRFFTRASLFDLLQQAGLQARECVPTPIPLNFVSPFFVQNSFGRWLHHALACITRWFPTLLGYQFVVLAIKR